MNSAGTAGGGPLAGRRVLVTRERPGVLAQLLEARGAAVVHVPLIALALAPDGGEALAAALDRLSHYDWLVVTSAAGAEQVGVAVRGHGSIRLAAVGTATARLFADLAERPVDVVPERQLATELADAIISHAGLPPARILVAQGDRAPSTLVEALREAGHHVDAVAAYSTINVAPDLVAVDGAEALVLASGSAAQSWADALQRSPGLRTPPIVVAIGPTTGDVARENGLKISGVAADHSLQGLVDELERQMARSGQ